MGVKHVKSDSFDQLLLVVHVKRCSCATLVAKQQNGLKKVKSDAFDQLLLLVHVKRCTYATLVVKQQNGLKTSIK